MTRIAIILRGITYANYNHKYNITCNIDARNTSDSIINNIINPLRESGMEVDIFFVTYKTDIDKELVEIYEPVDIHYRDFKVIPHNKPIEGGFMLINQHEEGINLVEKYEKINNIKYDNILITRFDLYFYKKITDLNVDLNVFNYTFYHLVYNPKLFSVEDNFILYPRKYNDIIKQCFSEIKKYNQTTHLLGKHLLMHGNTIKFLFGHKGSGEFDYPLYKFARHLYGNSKRFNCIEDNMKIKMNRIDTLKEYTEHDGSIYFKKEYLEKIGF
jgi:hypothetical protein